MVGSHGTEVEPITFGSSFERSSPYVSSADEPQPPARRPPAIPDSEAPDSEQDLELPYNRHPNMYDNRLLAEPLQCELDFAGSDEEALFVREDSSHAGPSHYHNALSSPHAEAASRRQSPESEGGGQQSANSSEYESENGMQRRKDHLLPPEVHDMRGPVVRVFDNEDAMTNWIKKRTPAWELRYTTFPAAALHYRRPKEAALDQICLHKSWELP
ncbi:hypothetical protein LTR17_013941 [Elasticomyces elasticus]|nr:hypothetical protein LTR17_013941 [Elasticomyces elasticus]